MNRNERGREKGQKCDRERYNGRERGKRERKT